MNGEWAGNSSTYLLRLKNLEIRSPGIIDFSQDVETTLKFCERRRRSAFHRLDGGVSAASCASSAVRIRAARSLLPLMTPHPVQASQPGAEM
jgi:hypothetical protein